MDIFTVPNSNNQNKDIIKELLIFFPIKILLIIFLLSILIFVLFLFHDCIIEHIKNTEPYKIVGWIGSVCFAYSALPQVIQVWRTKKTRDLAWGTVISWFIGEVCSLYYIAVGDFLLKGLDWKKYQLPLYFNYTANIILLIYLIYAKKKYKE